MQEISERSSSQSENELYRIAVFHHDQGNGARAMEVARPLSERGYDPADFLLGLIHEFGTYTSKVDIAMAVAHYRRAAVASRTSTAYRHLARALMKSGHESYSEALRCLVEAGRERGSPEIDLGFAWYHETSTVPDLRLACKFYLRAAARGRFLGFFGYSRAARKAGLHFRALVVDCLRVVSGVFLFIVLGSKTRNTF